MVICVEITLGSIISFLFTVSVLNSHWDLCWDTRAAVQRRRRAVLPLQLIFSKFEVLQGQEQCCTHLYCFICQLRKNNTANWSLLRLYSCRSVWLESQSADVSHTSARLCPPPASLLCLTLFWPQSLTSDSQTLYKNMLCESVAFLPESRI